MKSHNESTLQRACVTWFRLAPRRYSGVFFSVPNGGARNVVTGAILKAEGALRGVSDLILLVPRGRWHGLCIEMKAEGGRQSPHQKAFEQAATEQGYRYIVIRSFDEFRAEIEKYLNTSTA